uniref:hybrid sensor histidine kinase/response regulator n=1 Tax=Candidatus Electronema sp. TaxID=2698783 RepID=UPI004057700D
MSDRAKDLVLIVDDQPASLKVLLSFLQEQDFELRILQSGRQTLEMIGQIQPDIILLDVLMPDMDGLETCRRIKADPAWAEIPVVFMTALHSAEDKVAGFAAGGVDYITKPFQQDEVLARISTQLSLRRQNLRLKAAKEELQCRQTMLEALLDSIPDSIYFKDMSNRYLGCNRAFEQFSGRTAAELTGRTDEEVLPPGLAAVFSRQDQALLAACAAERREELLVRPDGGSALFDVLKSPYIGEDGAPLGLIGIWRNITGEKEAERRAEAERERLAVTLHSIGDGVIATDVAGRVSYLNKVAEQLTGWTAAEAAGKSSAEVFKIVHEETGAACADPVRRVLELGELVLLEAQTALIRRDSRPLSVADSCAPVRDREGRIIGTVIVFRDVTVERRKTEELIRVKKLESLSLLAAGIAHDFNNILFAILGNIELAATLAGASPAAPLLADARKATERAAKLTQQLLIFAKGGEPMKEITSLADLIRDSAEFVLHGSPVSCAFDFAEDLRLINADSGQISQVIQNIILNARDAMPGGGAIRIACANADGEERILPPGLRRRSLVRITIQDSGPGIAPEIMDKIFDPYFTTKPEGNGLGLAICHTVVKKHDGHIAVRSEPGQGAVFSIWLPAEAAAAQAVLTEEQETAPPLPRRVLVMDDDEMLRKLVQAQLRALGHEAVLAADGEEAVRLFRQLREEGRPADFVIMDLTIPGGMGGKETARLLLAEDPDARLIVASGYSNDPVLAEYRNYGFRAAVAKPFNLQELRQAIAAAL